MNAFSLVEAQFIQIQPASPETCKNSTICGTAPDMFVMMLDFVRDILNSIKTIGTEWEYLGEYVSPNRFQGNDFVPPQKTLVGKVARNTMQKLTFVTALSAVFSDSSDRWGVKEAVGNTILVAKNEVFLRDNTLVEKMESLLNDKKYELGMGGWRYTGVSDINLVIMNTILEDYKKKWLFIDDSFISKSATYSDITSVLSKILSAMKNFLYFDTTDQFISIRENQDIKVFFSPEVITSLQNSYDCARGFLDVCDKNKTTFKTIRKDISTKRKTSPLDNKKVFSDANDRLKLLFTANKSEEQKKEFDDIQYQLVWSTYARSGLIRDGVLFDTTNMFSENEGSLWKVWSAFGDLGRWIADTTVMVATWAAAIFTGTLPLISRTRKIIRKPSDRVKNYDDVIVGEVPLFGNEQYATILKSSVVDIFDRQIIDQELVGYVEVKDITPAFAILGDQISTIKTNVIWNKDTDNTLIKSLGEACETQCGRGGLCR